MAQSLAVVCLPLDDRPCNTYQLEALAEVGGIALKLPPRELIATHGTWDFEKIYEWLDFQMGWHNAALISADMFLYGGLIRSRRSTTTNEDVEYRFEKLSEIVIKHDCRIYVSSVLLRLSITVDAAQSESDWKNIFRYSVLKDKADSGVLGAAEELFDLEEKISTSLLKEYLFARERNANANRLLLDLIENVDYLMFGQEDCAPYGLHRKEKLALQTRIDRLGPVEKEKCHILTGADEMQALLLARTFADRIESNSKTPICFSGFNDANKSAISNYEDISVAQNITLHLKSTPFYEDEKMGVRVVCLPFQSNQEDIYFCQQNNLDIPSPVCDLSFDSNDAILDLSFANGAHPQTVKTIFKKGYLPLAFSAWNTTGNRLGTLFAHLSLVHVAQKNMCFDAHASENYSLLRFLDDGLYQGVLRTQLARFCRENSINPWALSSTEKRTLEELGQKLFDDYLSQTFLKEKKIQFQLLWPRIFEAHISIQK